MLHEPFVRIGTSDEVSGLLFLSKQKSPLPTNLIGAEAPILGRIEYG